MENLKIQNLEGLRDKIDEIDEKIVELLNKRAEAAFLIKKLKLANNLPVLDQEREEEIHKTIKKMSNGLLKEEDLERIYALLLEVMRGIGNEA